MRNQFSCKCRQAVCFAVGITDVEGDVTSLDITERLHVGAQRLREGSAGLAGKNEKNAENWQGRLLRSRRERPRRSCTTQNTQKFSPPHVHPKAQEAASYRLKGVL